MLEDFIKGVVVQPVLITFFVLSVLVLMEYVNVRTQGKSNVFVQKHPNLQIILATFLGLMPGCVGSMAVVSMYTHNVVGFGALVANMIATTGEEGMMMFGLIPEKALVIFGILLVISIVTGYAFNFFSHHSNRCGQESHFVIHPAHDAVHSHSLHGKLSDNFSKISFHRIILAVSLIAFIVLVAMGYLGDYHELGAHAGDHDGDHEHGFDLNTIFFILFASLSLIVVLVVKNHFLEEHIWHHVIGEHFLKIFLGTFAAFAIIFVVVNVCDLKEIIESFGNQNVYIVCLLAAIILGLFPFFGINMFLASLYFSGILPFGALLANSIVQDGHGAMPLLAESGRDFCILKGVKVIIALIAGFLSWWI